MSFLALVGKYMPTLGTPPISFVSPSMFSKLDFSDERDGTIFAIETPGAAAKPLDIIFETALGQLKPLWHHIKDVHAIESHELYSKNFYFRVMRLGPDGHSLEVLDLAAIEEFWLGCSHPVLNSPFLDPSKASLFKVDNLGITSARPWSFDFMGESHVPQMGKKPSFILELATRTDGISSSLLFEKMLHKSFHDQWLASIPEETDKLSALVTMIKAEKETIEAKLAEDSVVLLNFTKEAKDPRYVLINKLSHKIEAYYIRNSTAYGLTTLSNYHIVKITDIGAYELLNEAKKTCLAYSKFFDAQFEFRLNHSCKYIAYKMNGWNSFPELLKSTASKSIFLKSKDLDHAVMSCVKSLCVIHRAGVELNSLNLSRFFCSLSGMSKYNFQIMVSKGFPFTDGVKDIKSLAIIMFNLWVKYKIHQDVEFLETEALTPEVEAEIITFCEMTKAIPGVPAVYAKKIDYIIKLLQGTIALRDFSAEFELFYNQIYYGVVAGIDHAPAHAVSGGGGSVMGGASAAASSGAKAGAKVTDE